MVSFDLEESFVAVISKESPNTLSREESGDPLLEKLSSAFHYIQLQFYPGKDGLRAVTPASYSDSCQGKGASLCHHGISVTGDANAFQTGFEPCSFGGVSCLIL